MDQQPISDAWYEKRPLYEELAKALRGGLDGDTRFPHEAVYAVKHRLKSNERLVQKCKDAGGAITVQNFSAHINDLVGLRIVCLRPSDIEVVKGYLDRLKEEDELSILEGPSEKKSFVLNPKVEFAESQDVDFQYSGYSSIHYIVGLGPKRPVSNPALRNLRAELQVRNLFEETWGEIDHKYRYEHTRIGLRIPEAVDSGFRVLAMYLAAASYHAEYLCRLTTVGQASAKPGMPTASIPSSTAQPGVADDSTTESPLTLDFLRELFAEVLLIHPSARTIEYGLRRMEAHAKRNRFTPTRAWAEQLIRDSAMRSEFEQIYRDIFKADPFHGGGIDRDAVDLVNYAMFRSAFPRDSVNRRLQALFEERASGSSSK